MRTQNPKYGERLPPSKLVTPSNLLKSENENLQNDIKNLIGRGGSRDYSSHRKTADGFTNFGSMKRNVLNDDSFQKKEAFFGSKTENNFYVAKSITADMFKTYDYENSKRLKTFDRDSLDNDEKIAMKVLGAKED